MKVTSPPPFQLTSPWRTLFGILYLLGAALLGGLTATGLVSDDRAQCWGGLAGLTGLVWLSFTYQRTRARQLQQTFHNEVEWSLAERLQTFQEERARSKLSLRASEERFRAAIEGSLDAFFILQGPHNAQVQITNFHFVETNRRAEELFGRTREQLLGQDVAAILPGSPLAGSLATFPQVLWSGKPLEETFAFPTRSNGAVGLPDTRWFQQQIVPLANGLAVTVRDITDRRRSIEELCRSEARLQALVASLDEIVIEYDGAGTYVNVWTTNDTLLARPRSELIGQRLDRVLGPERAQPYLQIIHEVLRTNRPGSLEYSLNLGGRDYWFIAHVSPIVAQQGAVKTVCMLIRDITERKRAEEQLRSSLNEKDTLLKEIHHRVKNNLQIISSLLNLQAAKIRDAQSAGVFRESQNRIRSMALIHESLYQSHDLARIDVSLYFRTLCAHLCRSYGVESDRVKLQVQVEGATLGLDMAIPCGLIVNELVTNALKYAFPNGRPGRVTVEFRVEGHRGILVRVADDGVGLPPKLDLDRTDSLGLRLVRTLTEQINGNLEVSRKGGTQFQITLNEEAMGSPE
jgi:PAS domain S-box-containing protein